MPGGWGSAKNKIRIGVFWDGIQYNSDKSQARITDPRIAIDRGVNIDDSSNSLSWSGGAVTDGSDSNINVDGSGEKRIKNVSGQWQTLSYTDTTTVSFSAEFAGVNYAGGTLYASKSVTFPKRAVSKPDAPSGLSMSGSESSRTFTWTITSTTAAPVVSTTVYRSINDEAFLNVATVNSPTTTITVTDLPVNSKIVYRFFTKNAAGESTGYVDSEAIYTTPTAPSNVSAVKLADGTIQVSYDDSSAYETGFKIQDSPDGSTWSDAVASTTDRPWIHTSPNTSVTHRYRVQAIAPGGLVSAWSNTSNVIQLLAKPNAPTNLGPTGARPPSEALTLSYTHNPTDSSPQTQRNIQYQFSSNGGASWSAWTDLVTSSTSSQTYTVAAGTFGVGLLKWRVRTKGLHVDWSDYSAESVVPLTTRPTTTILEPTSPFHSSRLVVELGYADSYSAQSSATVRVYNDDTNVLLFSRVESGPVLEFDFSGHPLPEGNYRIEASTTNGAGLSSEIVSEVVEVEYPPPATPDVFATAWDEVAGSLTISTSNAAGDGTTTVDTVSQTLYRVVDGVREPIATFDPDASFLDETPVTSGPSYVLVAWSAEGASAEYAFTVDPDPGVQRWVYLNKPSVRARFRAGIQRKRSASLAQSVSNYAGRAEAVSTYGEAVTEGSSFSMVLLLAEGTDWMQLRKVVLTPGDAIVRTPDGLRFWAAVPTTEATDSDLIYQQATLQLVHVGQ